MRKSIICIAPLALMLSSNAPPAIADEKPALDTAAIEAAAGLKGTFNNKENVFKVSKPRTDVHVRVDGLQMPPFMGLTSWAAFTPGHGGTMLMGDTVLFEDEVNPVMSVALENGLQVTALHNHFFFDEPKVYFMHIGGMGDAGALAGAVKKIYGKVAEIRAAHPEPQSGFEGSHAGSPSKITGDGLEKILGEKGQAKDGMFKVVIGRTTSMHGSTAGNEMGVNTWAAFAGTDDAAIVDGDFAISESELQAVLRAMRKEGINIVAIHQHMTGEEPRVLFLHFWGTGKAEDLARSLRQVLDAQGAVAK